MADTRMMLYKTKFPGVEEWMAEKKEYLWERLDRKMPDYYIAAYEGATTILMFLRRAPRLPQYDNFDNMLEEDWKDLFFYLAMPEDQPTRKEPFRLVTVRIPTEEAPESLRVLTRPASLGQAQPNKTTTWPDALLIPFVRWRPTKDDFDPASKDMLFGNLLKKKLGEGALQRTDRHPDQAQKMLRRLFGSFHYADGLEDGLIGMLCYSDNAKTEEDVQLYRFGFRDGQKLREELGHSQWAGDDLEGMTYRRMCEFIVAVLEPRYGDGTKLTAKQVFKMHPTGELFPVHEIFELACAFASPWPKCRPAQQAQERYMSREGYEAIALDGHLKALAANLSIIVIATLSKPVST